MNRVKCESRKQIQFILSMNSIILFSDQYFNFSEIQISEIPFRCKRLDFECITFKLCYQLLLILTGQSECISLKIIWSNHARIWPNLLEKIFPDLSTSNFIYEQMLYSKWFSFLEIFPSRDEGFLLKGFLKLHFICLKADLKRPDKNCITAF